MSGADPSRPAQCCSKLEGMRAALWVLRLTEVRVWSINHRVLAHTLARNGPRALPAGLTTFEGFHVG